MRKFIANFELKQPSFYKKIIPFILISGMFTIIIFTTMLSFAASSDTPSNSRLSSGDTSLNSAPDEVKNVTIAQPKSEVVPTKESVASTDSISKLGTTDETKKSKTIASVLAGTLASLLGIIFPLLMAKKNGSNSLSKNLDDLSNKIKNLSSAVKDNSKSSDNSKADGQPDSIDDKLNEPSSKAEQIGSDTPLKDESDGLKAEDDASKSKAPADQAASDKAQKEETDRFMAADKAAKAKALTDQAASDKAQKEETNRFMAADKAAKAKALADQAASDKAQKEETNRFMAADKAAKAKALTYQAASDKAQKEESDRLNSADKAAKAKALADQVASDKAQKEESDRLNSADKAAKSKALADQAASAKAQKEESDRLNSADKAAKAQVGQNPSPTPNDATTTSTPSAPDVAASESSLPFPAELTGDGNKLFTISALNTPVKLDESGNGRWDHIRSHKIPQGYSLKFNVDGGAISDTGDEPKTNFTLYVGDSDEVKLKNNNYTQVFQGKDNVRYYKKNGTNEYFVDTVLQGNNANNSLEDYVKNIAGKCIPEEALRTTDAKSWYVHNVELVSHF